MGSKTKIIVLHMKEIIYTILFILLGIILILLLFFMFLPKTKSSSSSSIYTPGVYTSAFTLGQTPLEVEITVDESHINAIRFSNLEESVTTAYPLLQSSMEDIADQICRTQSTEDLVFSSDSPYTCQVILHAIEDALAKASTVP